MTLSGHEVCHKNIHLFFPYFNQSKRRFFYTLIISYCINKKARNSGIKHRGWNRLLQTVGLLRWSGWEAVSQLKIFAPDHIRIKKPANPKIHRLTITWKRESCRGRDRTSTRRLAATQRVSGQSWSAWRSALCYVYPVILTLETRGHVCLKFHHPTVYSDLILRNPF